MKSSKWKVQHNRRANGLPSMKVKGSQADSYVISTKLGIRKFQKSGAGAVENCLVVPQKLKLSYAPTIPHLRNILKRFENRYSNKYTHTNVHSSTIRNSRKARTQVFTLHELMNRQTKIRYTHTMEYYSATKERLLISTTHR